MTQLRQLPAAQTPSATDIIPIQQYLLNVATGITTDTTCGITPSALLSGFGITATGSTTARTAAAWFSDEANVIAFGADPTGVLDSTAAIQAAINAVQASAANGPAVLSSGGGGSIDGQAYKAVYLPGGQYLVSGSLIISYPVIFRGAGPRATTIFSTNPATPVLAIVPQYLSGHNYYNSGVVGVVVVKDLAIKGATPVYTTTSDSQQINMMTDGHAIFLGQATNNSLYARVDLQNLLIEYATVDGISAAPPVSTSVCTALGCLSNATFQGYVNAREVTIGPSGRHGVNMGSAFDWRWFGGEIQSSGGSGLLIAGGGGMTMVGTNIYSNAQSKAWNGWYNTANSPPTPTTTTYNGQTVPITPAAYNVIIYQTAGGTNTGNNTFVGCAIDAYPYGGIFYNVQQTFYQTRFLGGAIGSWNHSSPTAGNYPSVYIPNLATALSLKFESVEFEPPYSWSGSATGYVSTNFLFASNVVLPIYVLAILPWGFSKATNKVALLSGGPINTGFGSTLRNTGAKTYLNAAIPVTARGPNATDDTTKGYSVGNYWNAPNGVYSCIRNTSGFGVWNPATNFKALPLDAVKGVSGGAAPAAAYGLRLLSKTYAGKAINVVRASDSTNSDIGFLADGSLDEATLWQFLDGTTGVVATWYDQSGNGNNATQSTAANRPRVGPMSRIGNTPSIVCDMYTLAGAAATLYLSIPAGATAPGNALSMFALMQTSQSNYNTGYFGTLESSTGSTNCTSFALQQYGAGIDLYGPTLAQAALIPTMTPQINGYVLSGSAPSIYVGEVTGGSGVGSVSYPQAGGVIGGCYVSGSLLNGPSEFGALFMYGRVLSTNEIAALYASTYRTFNVTSQVRDQLVWYGDSITAGNYATFLQNRPRKVLERMGRSINATNMALSGRTLAQMVSGYAAEVHPLYNANATNNVLSIFAGTNDIIGGATAAAVYANLQTLCNSAKADGWTVAVGTMLPRSDLTGGEQTIWTAYNGLIRSGFAAGTLNCDAVVDFQADPLMGLLATASNTTYYADGIHPTDLGYDYLASIEAPVLDLLFS